MPEVRCIADEALTIFRPSRSDLVCNDREESPWLMPLWCDDRKWSISVLWRRSWLSYSGGLQLAAEENSSGRRSCICAQLPAVHACSAEDTSWVGLERDCAVEDWNHARERARD